MNPVLMFDGCEANYINSDRLQTTVRLVPNEDITYCSYGDVINGMVGMGVNPDDVEAVYKVSTFDSSFSVMLAYSDTVQDVINQHNVSVGKNTFQAMKMSEQILTLRVHWLPIYFDSSILKEIFGQYGQVIDVKMLKSAQTNIVAFHGVHEVRLKVDGFQKQQIPHLVKFHSGQSVLITMNGRPPYCMKCQSIGHVRQRCPGKTFASVTRDKNIETATSDPARIQPPGPSSPGPGNSGGP